MVSFASEWTVYFAIIVLGILVAVFYCVLQQFPDCAGTEHRPIRDQDIIRRETEPILPGKEVIFSYGATEEQPESSVCSAEDLHSEEMCRICYDAPRSCFFIPCGHCVSCFTCARSGLWKRKIRRAQSVEG
ncbi:hypothetical protein ACP4OV_017417 [Aristida adscensionis]